MKKRKLGRPPKPYKTVNKHLSLREETDRRIEEVRRRHMRGYSDQADVAINRGLDVLEAEEQ